jgi:hypothetical protein
MSEANEVNPASGTSGVERLVSKQGYEALWQWFSCSYASWLTLPRVMMHEMPDEWQGKMAELLQQWDEKWDSNNLPSPRVNAVGENGKLTKWPEWILNYRSPQTN